MATYSSIAHNFTPPTATTSAQVGTGAVTLIKTITASSSSTVSFVNGSSSVVLDSTYKTYYLKMINVHNSSATNLGFQMSSDGGSNYNIANVTNQFRCNHAEGGGSEAFGNDPPAPSTNFIVLGYPDNTNADENSNFELWIFNPSDTTFVTHFIAHSTNQYDDVARDVYTGGYFNTTSALNAIQFKPSGGNFAEGTFKLYGIA